MVSAQVRRVSPSPSVDAMDTSPTVPDEDPLAQSWPLVGAMPEAAKVVSRKPSCTPASAPSSPGLGATALPRPYRDIANGPIVIGVCAMHKKATSAPMKEMLNRLTSFQSHAMVEFTTVYFEEDMILNQPVEEWPVCEALIAFFSTGFPLHKAQSYARLHPLVAVFNDLEQQEVLHDRRLVYQRLQENGVPVPTYTVYNAEQAASTTVDESEDYLEINGVRINKPLVEKPISGEDHNIYLYYPRSQGGGSKRLFRKVGSSLRRPPAAFHCPPCGSSSLPWPSMTFHWRLALTLHAPFIRWATAPRTTTRSSTRRASATAAAISTRSCCR